MSMLHFICFYAIVYIVNIEKQKNTQKPGPDFEKWQFRYPEGVTDDDIVALAGKRDVVYAPTESFHENGEEQQLAVFVTKPEEQKGPEIIVRLGALNVDFANDMSAVFDAYLAESTGRRVFSIATPGISNETPEGDITPEQGEELKEGSFRKLGAAGLRAAIFTEALERANDESETDNVELPRFIYWGGSQGAAALAGLANEAITTGAADQIAGLIFDEVANTHERSKLNLIKGAKDAGADTQGYIDQNPEALRDADEGAGPYFKRMLRRGRTNYKYLNALTKGRFREDLGDPEKFHDAGFDAPVLVVHGSRSTQSLPEQNDELVEWLESAGVPVEQVELENDGHDRLINVQSAVELVQRVIK